MRIELNVKALTFTIILMFMILGCLSVNARQQTFEIGNKEFLLNGKHFVIKAAEMHYTRIPAEYWEHRIEMCKALGMNTICLYAFWNSHEQKPGQFDFTGQNNIAEFCKLAQKHGMYVILRPGPYVCAEWEMGGLPWWLLKKNDIQLRTCDSYFIERTDLFMRKLGEQLADMQITKGGNIIMVQVENEYGGYGIDKKYISTIRDIVRKAGFDSVPLFQCDWSSTFQLNGLDDLLWTINFGTGANIEEQFKPLIKARPNTPLMCSEFWSGWFDHWGRKHETRDAKTMVAGLKDMLERNISFSLYMTHGGTSFGHWGGANNPPYSTMCSSYDYDAPISEAGWPTPKYYELRNLLLQYADHGQVIPDVPDIYPVINVPEIVFHERADLFLNLPKAIESDSIKPMEMFGQGWGSILYRTYLPEIKEGSKLFIDEVHDWAQVYVDGELIGRLDRRNNENLLSLPHINKGARLDILVEAMGRVNFDKSIHDYKGITHKVELLTDTSKFILNGWKVYNLPDDADFVADMNFVNGESMDAPAYYRATFKLDSVGDTFIDMHTWGKGMVWVNGKSIGRFWEIGPQQTLYMPGCWLKKGDNEIVVLDLKGPEKAKIVGLEKPILDMLRSNEVMIHRKDGEYLNLKQEKPVASGTFKLGNGWQTINFKRNVKGRFFCLESLNAHDGKEIASISELRLLDAKGNNISRQNWKIIYADSESTIEGNYTADKIFDLQESTYWKTLDDVNFPHYIVIDLGKEYEIGGISYIPRAEEGAPGAIKSFNVYMSDCQFDIILKEKVE